MRTGSTEEDRAGAEEEAKDESRRLSSCTGILQLRAVSPASAQ